MTRLRETVRHAGYVATRQHDGFEEDTDGFIVCKCGIPVPDQETWADHYAGSVLGAAIEAIPEDYEG